MAKVNKEEAKKEKKETPKGFGNTRKKMTDEERLAKKKARMEAIKNRPKVQRPNSKQVDVIESEDGGMVKVYAQKVSDRSGIMGSLITTVAYNKDGVVVSVSTTFVNGVQPKTKKGHGRLIPVSPEDAEEGEGEDEEEAEGEGENGAEDED